MIRFKFSADSQKVCMLFACFVLFYSTSFAQDQQQEEVPPPEVRSLSESGETVDPIEALFGKGYICLHIDDPKHASSPAFQAFALELAKKYNKTTKVEVGSNETDVHEHVTWRPPPVNIGSNEDSDEVTLSKNKHKPTKKPKQDVADTGKKIKPKCTEPGFFVHPIHCNKYYRCVEPVGKSTKYKLYNFVCGPGTIFDESLSTCNHPSDVEPKPPCWDHEGEPDTDDDDAPPPPGQTEQNLEDGDTDDPPPDVDEDSGEGLTKVKTKPKKPKGEDDGEDWIPKLPGTPKEKDPAKLKEQKKKIKDAVEDILTKTKNKPKRKTTTPPPVQDDDDEDNDEDDDQQVEEETPICSERGTFPYEHSCRKFYQCVANKGSYEMIHYDCDPGEIYDPKEEECRPRASVVPKPKNCRKKKKRTSTTITEVETEDTEDESNEPDTVTTRERTSMFPQTSSEEVSDEDTSKPHPHCDEEGTFSHPTNCSKFYRCDKKDGSDHFERKNFICEKGSIFDGEMCTHASTVKPKPPCADHDPRYSPKSKAKKKIEEIQGLTKTKTKPKRPKGNVNDDQHQAVIDDADENHSQEVVDESSEALTKVKHKPKKKNNQTTTTEDEVVEYEYEEFTDDKGVVKTRRRRTKGHEEYEYETTTDEDGNVVRVKKPKGATDEEEYETIVDKDGKTVRRRKKKKTSSTTTITEDVSYEDDDDEKSVKPKKPKKPVEDDEYEIVEKGGKKVKRRKKKVTTKTTTETTDDEHTDNDSEEEDGLTKVKNKPPKKKPSTQESHETDIDTIIDEDGNSTKKKRKKSTSKTTTTTTEEHESHEDEDNDDDDDTPGLTKVKSKPKRKPGTEDDSETTSEPPHDCPDDSELIARLTKERDEAVANAANLSVANAKLTKDMAKLNKSLEAAVRAKIAAQEHMKKMDKTIESYKQDSEWLKNCCDEKLENEAAARNIAKSRKRRSIEEAFSKSRFTSRVAREKGHTPKEIASEELDEPPKQQAGASFEQETQLTTTPSSPDRYNLRTYEKEELNNQTKSSNSNDQIHRRSKPIFTRELPLLIFIFLTLLLFSVVFLGCYIIKKLNRMTTFAISPEELDEYCKQHDGHLHNCSLTHKKKLYKHSDSYFAYANPDE